ncbi:MAG: tetratricopeptide repeat protein [Nitrospiraceae bacterium]|nr:tetratricopeptide repeat protein [Nitrospiraceae bacterium]
MARETSAHRPLCPFCGRPIKPPKEVEPRRLANFDYGVCDCGAVYVHDVTGHNLGAAYVEALGFACNDDWDLAWSLEPGEDYEDAIVEGYDFESHVVYPGKTTGGKRAKGALSFIRLIKDVREVTQEGVNTRIKTLSGPKISEKDREKRYADDRAHRYSKKDVQVCVESRDIDKLKEMALRDSLVLRKIQRLLYSADQELMWKAVSALGKVAGALTTEKPTVVGDLVRRLLLATGDSAAANWGSVETLGEIIRNQPVIYGSFLQNLVGFLEDPPSRPSILWAIGRVGELHPKLVRSKAFFSIFSMLKDPSAKVRGHAAWAFGRIKAQEALKALQGMIDDPEKLSLFDGRKLIHTTVGRLASDAIEHIRDKDQTVSDQKENNMSEQAALNPQEDTGKTEDTDERLSKAEALYEEAKDLGDRGISTDALQKFEEALGLFEIIGDREVEAANICEKIGDLRVMQGNIKGAMPAYQRGMTICEKKHDPISTVLLIEKIVDLYRQLKELDKALPYYFRALELVEGFQDAGKAGLYLTGIGDIYEKRGDLDNALDAYRTAHNIYQETASRERAQILEKGIKKLEAKISGNPMPEGE